MSLISQLSRGLPTPPGLNLLNSTSPSGLARAGLSAVPGRELMNWAGLPSPVPNLRQVASNAATVPSNSTVNPRNLALMASDVYNSGDQVAPPPGYRVASSADLQAIGLNANDLAGNSGFRARVYVNGSGANAEYVVSFRGTQSSGDWATNARQALGANTDHYQRALQIGDKVARSGNDNVTFTGHSLGGGLASAAAVASGRDAVTFNAAGLSDATIRSANTIRSSAGAGSAGNVDAYFVRGDILSGLQDGGDRALGALLFGPIGFAIDAPSAYGNRIGLDGVRPSDVKWYQDNPVSRHGMNWVLNSLPR
jgi:hypothetical protein